MATAATLEDALAKIAADNDLTSVNLGLMMVGARKVWCASVHWNEQHACASGMRDDSCIAALGDALAEAAARRAPTPVIPDALPTLAEAE